MFVAYFRLLTKKGAPVTLLGRATRQVAIGAFSLRQTMPKAMQTLLCPKHFEGMATQFTESGLHFNERIGPDLRSSECPNLDRSQEEIEAQLYRLTELRLHTKVVLNPLRPSVKALSAAFKLAQERSGMTERISVGYGLPARYDRAWSKNSESELDSEGQDLVFVAFQNMRPVGYAGMRVSLTHLSGRPRIVLRVRLELVYVIPAERGQGYGLDLSVACGLACQDVLVATYRAVKSGTIISITVDADYESKGGEAFTEHILDCLEFGVDTLREDGRRRSIKLRRVELAAGY